MITKCDRRHYLTNFVPHPRVEANALRPSILQIVKDWDLMGAAPKPFGYIVEMQIPKCFSGLNKRADLSWRQSIIVHTNVEMHD